jgi:hypothetical protein
MGSPPRCTSLTVAPAAKAEQAVNEREVRALSAIASAWCLRENPSDDSDVDDALDEASDEASDETSERVIRCAQCGHVVTRPRHRFAMNGRPDHVFTNPSGHTFHIACFREAEGAAGVGEESDEWAWFEGWVWQAAVCRGCLTHIGWAFRQGESEFWGLILAKLES